MSRRCLSVTCLLLAVGCGRGDGPELVPVTGTVKLDGQPLPGATIHFIPQGKKGGRPAKAVTDDDGDFEMKYSAANKGVPPGRYEVRITTLSVDENDNEIPEKLPDRYHVKAANNPEMVKEVKADEKNEFEFDLSSKGEFSTAKSSKKPKRRRRRAAGCCCG